MVEKNVIRKKVLPITTEPYMRLYTHHGYYHAIIGTEDKVNKNESKEVAEICVKDFNEKEWRSQNDQLRYEIDAKGNIKFFSNRWNYEMNMSFWRECQQNDEVEIDIKKQLYSNPWGSITLFITSAEQQNMNDMKEYDIRVGNFSKDGIYSCINKKNCLIWQRNTSFPLKLRLMVKNGKISMEYNRPNEESKKILIKELDELDKTVRIGFAINMGNNSYNEWVYSNYINIYREKGAEIEFDFLNNAHKNWNLHTTNYFLDYSIDSEQEINRLGFGLLNYIKKQIDLNRYIEIENNERFIFHDAYQTYFHQQLIYGYDDQKRCLYLLYYNFGKIERYAMSYDDFLSEKNRQENKMVYVFKYNPGYEKYELSLKHILQVYKEYYAGENITYYEPKFEKIGKFGIACLEELCTEEGAEHLGEDIRISQLLYEHTMCNKDRIAYLSFRNMIPRSAYDMMNQILEDELNAILIIQNLAMRKLLGKKVEINKFYSYMCHVLEYDKKFSILIIDTLESVLKDI